MRKVIAVRSHQNIWEWNEVLEYLRAQSTIGPKQLLLGTFESWLPFSELRDPAIHEALDYWTAKRGTRPLPLISDFKPAEVARLLPFIVVADRSGTPPQFRYSIVGEAQKDASGMNFTGMTTEALDHLGHDFRQKIEALYRGICEKKEPCGTAGRLPLEARSFYQYECIHLPFSRRGDVVDRIIAVAIFELLPLPASL